MITLINNYNYSGASINGPSQKRTTSQKRTLTNARIDAQNNLRDRDNLSTRDRGNIPKCSLLGGSTVYCVAVQTTYKYDEYEYTTGLLVVTSL